MRGLPVADLADEDDEPPDPGSVERARALFAELAEVAEADVDPPEEEVESLSFELAARVDFSLELKQELLELTSERARLRRLCDLLDRAATLLVRRKQIAARAARNGRVAR